MGPIYLGVDIAGQANTWVAALSESEMGLKVVVPPRRSTLREIVTYCEENEVLAVAIDGQLSAALSDENGFRSSDRQLRQRLPPAARSWVGSINSLMAVPVRSRLLAGSLAPIVGTILETHPRASLFFGLDQALHPAVFHYKKGPEPARHIASLWQHWAARFGLRAEVVPDHDGGLDSLVCATIAYLYHRDPARLLKLKDTAPDKTGYGPFYVLAPPAEVDDHG